ncbi:MBL fold metallo-hydrolase [Maribacter sp. 2307UL18-2]|uniref:MBL fold metallo-hydrolase n=1 Tax=Maribacter sp. 2307UL18-2 TaxID=3386274 RepID=UPI0039BD8AFA
MKKIYHLNCVQIESPLGSAIGHCVLIEQDEQLTLIDTGIGMAETREPEKRLGKELVALTGFKFDENRTAVRQIERLGLNPKNVTDIICSHLDPDHIGGTADFPQAKVHVSKEEYEAFNNGDERYLRHQLAHKPEMVLYENNDSKWFDLPARKLKVHNEVYLIPLFGHTLGHCGIAFENGGRWKFYIGDAYYLRAELTEANHPVEQLATIRAVDNQMRIQSLDTIRNFIKNYGDTIDYFGYHDPAEFSESPWVEGN